MKSLWAVSAAMCRTNSATSGRGEYFRDADAKEDAESEESLSPRPTMGKRPRQEKKEKVQKTEPKPAPKPADEKQLTFGDFGTEEAAG